MMESGITSNGPRRIIMIESGKYQYAEVEIDQGVHLVGGNNTGKTTLISTLQFLYIDNERSFKFSKDLARSRRYYFKNQYSYILFECQTSNGYMVVGVRGTSSMGTGDHERFIYNGSYRKDHYFNDDDTVKKGDEVKMLLSERGYRILKPSDIQSLLTGHGAAVGPGLNLLPIKDTGGYKKFRGMYKNLLELSNIGQDEVKSALIETCGSTLTVKNGIDFQKDYANTYHEIQKVYRETEAIKKAGKTIQESQKQYERVEEARTEMAAGYEIIKNEFRALQKKNTKDIEEIKESIDEEIDTQETLSGEINLLNDKIGVLNQNIGAKNKELELLNEARNQFKDYLPDIQRPIIEDLRQKILTIENDLARIKVEDLAVIKNRLAKRRPKYDELQRRLKNFDETFAKMLCDDFTEEELSKTFAVLNKNLLGRNIKDGSIEVKDVEGVKSKIRTILSRIKNGVYDDNSLRIVLKGIEPSDISQFFKMDELVNEMEAVKSEIDRDTKTLDIAQEQEDLKNKKNGLEKELSPLEKKHNDYVAFKGKESSIEPLEKEVKTLEKNKKEKEEELKEKGDILNKSKEKARKQQAKIEGIEKGEKALWERITRLRRPDPDWKIPEEYELLEYDLEQLINDHTTYDNQEQNENSILQANLDFIEITLGPSFHYDTQKEYLEYLHDELKNLDNKEQTVSELWKSALNGLNTELSGIQKDVETVAAQAKKINKALARIQISDLAGLKIQVNKNSQITDYINNLRKKAMNSPLLEYADSRQSSQPFQQLQNWLSEQGKIEVSDLFSLDFEIEKIDGEKEVYSSLTNVESNGTTITIKVLVNLMLMRGLFDNKQAENTLIPFYLDEVTSLDLDNARAVTQQAVNLGFTPIIASPSSAHIVNKIYQLEGGKKEGLYVSGNNMMDIEEKETF